MLVFFVSGSTKFVVKSAIQNLHCFLTFKVMRKGNMFELGKVFCTADRKQTFSQYLDNKFLCVL